MKAPAGSATLIVVSAVCGLLGWGLGKYTLPRPGSAEAKAPVARSSAVPPLGRGSRISPAAVTRAFADKKETETDVEFAKAWAAKDPQAFLAWLLQCQPQPAAELVAAFFKTWVLRNPDAAFEAARNLPPRFNREDVLPKMLNVLIEENMEAAFQWAGRLREEITGFSWPNEKWASGPPEQLAERISKLAPGFYPGFLVEQFTARWAQQDLKAAHAWADKLDPALRGPAMQAVLKAWAEQDMPGALEYLKTETKSQERQFGAFEVLLHLGSTEPGAALDWMTENMGVPDNNALRNILSSWLQKDAAAATVYVKNIDNPQLRLNALENLGEAWRSAASPVEWVEQLSSGAEKAAALKGLSMGWAWMAPAESSAYFWQPAG